MVCLIDRPSDEPELSGTPTESRRESVQREVTGALCIQGVKHVLQLLGRQRQLSVQPLTSEDKQKAFINKFE